MSIFNPQVQAGQDNSPNYFKYSEPISQPKADTSTGIALATAGEGIEGATKLADQTTKDVIKQDVYNKVDAERDAFTGALNTVRDSVIPAPVQTGSGSTALSLTNPDPSATVPSAVSVGLNRVDAVQAALVNGKINDTYYTQRLNSIAKDMRTQYPGYREYIDQRISEATGVNPANAYINNLMQDINRQSTKKDDERTKTETMLRGQVEQGAPNSDQALRNFQTGVWNADQAQQYVYETNKNMYTIKQQDAQRANAKGTKDEIASQRTDDFTREIGATVSNNFSMISGTAGTDNPQGILNLVQQAATNPGAANDQAMESLATKLAAQKALLSTQLKSRSNQLVNGHSYASDIGADKADNVIKSQLSVYDTVIDAIKNKDYGTAFSNMNQARAILDDTKTNVLKDPNVGSFVAKSKVFSDTMGPNWTGLVVNEGLRKDMDQKFRALYNESSMDARLGQPDAAGNIVSLNGHIQEAKAKGVNSGKYYSGLVDLVDDIKKTDAPMADKANIARYLYDPKNYSVLNNFKMDYTDPVTNKQVPGKYSVWTRLTNPDVSTEMAKMSKSDPQAGKMYQDWGITTGRELIGEDVRTLNHFTGHDNLSFDWDTQNRQLVLRDGGKVVPTSTTASPYGVGSTAPPTDKGYLFQVQKVLNRVNMGLSNLNSMNDAFNKGNTEEFLLNTLQQYGLDINGNIGGLPKKIGDAIAASRQPQRRIEDTFGNLNSSSSK